MEILKVKNLKTYFEIGKEKFKAVDDVSFSLNEGESLGLVGESGCGKTTTALSIMRLIPKNGWIADGEILYKGMDLTKKSIEDIRKFRWKEISIIFQGAMNALNPVLTVGEQIKEAILLHEKISETECKKRVLELFDMVEIDKKRVTRYPHEFSGGMKQRVMIAMALSLKPKIIIGDEPTTALDVMVQAQIFDLIERLKKELNMSMILITHDLSIIAENCQHTAVMYGGKILEKGETNEICEKPMNPYTKLLLESFPDLNKEKHMPSSIPGYPPDLTNPPAGCRFHPRCPIADGICASVEPKPCYISDTHSYSCHKGGAL